MHSYNFGYKWILSPAAVICALRRCDHDGGVPASVAVVANGLICTYPTAGYAVGQQNRGFNPASLPPRCSLASHLSAHGFFIQKVQNEIAQRVEAYLSLGPGDLPMAVRWSQPGDTPIGNNEFSLEVFGFEADLVRTLSKAYPYLVPAQQTRLASYLHTVVENTLLNPTHYAYDRNCIVFGTPGIQSGDQACAADQGIVTTWFVNNPNLIGLRLHHCGCMQATGD
jgi:hypothetical protein